MKGDRKAAFAEMCPRFFRTQPSRAETVAIAAMIVGVLVGLALPGGDQDFTHRFPPPGTATGRGDGFADVAGEYRQAVRGRHCILKLLPDGRYSFLWAGCCGVCRRESGVACRVDKCLVLSPVESAGQPAGAWVERTLCPVGWGRRRYLIPPWRLGEFRDAVARRDEPRGEISGRFYLLGHEVPAEGEPELPAGWADVASSGAGSDR
jgi:hypothetical protein